VTAGIAEGYELSLMLSGGKLGRKGVEWRFAVRSEWHQTYARRKDDREEGTMDN
jgi:hypothetical protein